jgi:hypothetical protein
MRSCLATDVISRRRVRRPSLSLSLPPNEHPLKGSSETCVTLGAIRHIAADMICHSRIDIPSGHLRRASIGDSKQFST